MKIFFLFLSISFLFLNCTEDPKEVKDKKSPVPEPYTALLFKKEKKIELWSTEKPKRLFKTLKDIELSPITIGYYGVDNDSIHLISNYISMITTFEHSEIIALPNDPRRSGILEPCFACSFEEASNYAKLEMIMKEYPLPSN